MLGILAGSYGAVGEGSNPLLTNGYGMFAPLTADMQRSWNGSPRRRGRFLRPDRPRPASRAVLDLQAGVRLGLHGRDLPGLRRDATRLGNAEGPGYPGALGKGTWVEARFSLERFKGRRARLRFLETDIKIDGTRTTWEQVFPGRFNPGSADDGIFIDDVEVTNT